MRAHDLQPVPFDGFRRVSSWLAEHRYRSTATRLFEAAAFPESWNIGLPGCLDGPMRVNDDGVLCTSSLFTGSDGLLLCLSL